MKLLCNSTIVSWALRFRPVNLNFVIFLRQEGNRNEREGTPAKSDRSVSMQPDPGLFIQNQFVENGQDLLPVVVNAPEGITKAAIVPRRL